MKKALTVFLALLLTFTMVGTARVQAEKALPTQEEALRLSDLLYESFGNPESATDFPEDMAGMYINDNNILVVMVTSEEAKAKYQEILGDSQGYQFEMAKWSYDEIQQELEDFVKDLDGVSYYVDIKNNRGVVRTENKNLSQAQTLSSKNQGAERPSIAVEELWTVTLNSPEGEESPLSCLSSAGMGLFQSVSQSLTQALGTR